MVHWVNMRQIVGIGSSMNPVKQVLIIIEP